MRQHIITHLVVVGTFTGCDVGDDGREMARQADLEEVGAVLEEDEDEELSGGIDDRDDSIANAANREQSDEEGRQSVPDDIHANVQPVAGGTPACDGILTPQSFDPLGCNFERATATSGTDALVSCDANELPISGGCYATSSSHHLVSHYIAEAANNVVDDEDDVDVGIGFQCSWDTAATAVNTHSVVALCCPTWTPPHC